MQMWLYSTNMLPSFFTAYHASHFNFFSTQTPLPDSSARPHIPLTIYFHDHQIICIITHKTRPNHPYHQVTTSSLETVQPPITNVQTVKNIL